MAGKPKSVLVIGVLAIAIAAFASISLYNYLKGQESKVKSAVATSKVVVAAMEIPVGGAINMSQVKLADWPQANLPAGSFPTTDQVVGRIPLDRYTAGEPIIEAKLVPKLGQPGVLSYKIPEGHRAMTVAVDQVAGVAGFIAPGNKVDVVLTTLPQGSQQPVSKIVLQNVPVLATGQIIEQQKDGKPVIVPTVTMDVIPDDAEKLAIASTQGKLQLVLRRAGDMEVTKTGGATVTKVMGGVEKVKPRVIYKSAPKKAAAKQSEMTAEKPKEKAAKPEEEAIKVEVLRGSQKSVEIFKNEKQ